MNKVIILCGISGSGKSTYAKNLSPAIICSTDNYFIKDGEYKFDARKLGENHSKCLRDFISFCNNIYGYEGNIFWHNGDPYVIGNLKIIIDNTNTSVAEIAPYASIALAYGFELEIKIIKCSAEKAFKRNQHGVPLEIIIKMANRIERLQEQFPLWWNYEIIEEK